MEEGEEIVHSLGKDARPIYGIDSCEAMSRVESTVCEETFYNILSEKEIRKSISVQSWCRYLTVVECTPDGKVVDVRVGDGSHLGFLDRGNATFRV